MAMLPASGSVLVRCMLALCACAGVLLPAAEGTGLLATYYARKDLSGESVRRVDATIDVDWGGGAPVAGVGADGFSVRWLGELEPLTSETYTFTTTSDDGVRLWIDGQLVIDQWNDHGAREDHGAIALTLGRRVGVVLEYYENTGAAVARLAWSSPQVPRQIIPTAQLHPQAAPGSGTGLTAQYYDGMDLSGPVLQRLDPQVDVDWGAGSPAPGIAPDTFSARWSGEVEARVDETYTFLTTSDDGVRLWVDGQLLIDHWTDHPATVDQGVIALRGGQRYTLVMEYYENAGAAVARLGWSSPSTPAGPIPTSQLYPAPVLGGGTGLYATYFDGQDLTGASVARVDRVVDFDWVGGSPAPSIAPDTFSARWAGEVQAEFSEVVTFETVSDDGIRLWVGGLLLIDHWTDHGAAVDRASLALVAGQRYPILLEYFEHAGRAQARLRWTSPRLPLQPIPASQLYPAFPSAGGTGLTATYYDHVDFSGPALTRLEPGIDVDWGAGSPDPSIGPDTFSARWSGEIQPHLSETYTFTTTSDDGIRVRIAGQLVIDHWSDHAASDRSGSIALSGGQRYPLVVEYYENRGAAVARLAWASPSTPFAIVPTSQLFPAGAGLAPPTLTPPGGTYAAALAVTLATSTPGAVVRYTLDGSDPGATSPVASGPVAITVSTTLTARSFLDGQAPSAAVSATYVLVPATPVIAPPGGTFAAPQVVTVTTATPGAQVRATLDGSEPLPTSPLVTGPITIDHSATLRARAFVPGWTPSAEATAVFVITTGGTAPTVAVPAAADPAVVTGTTTALSVLGADDQGEAALTYTWSVTGPPGVMFDDNASNAAKATVARFAAVGTYQFLATIGDGEGLSVTSAVSVVVQAVAQESALVIDPPSAEVPAGATLAFTATPPSDPDFIAPVLVVRDQFGTPIPVTWSAGQGGTIDAAGLFTAGPVLGGPVVVSAAAGGLVASTEVTIIAPTSAPTVAAPAAAADQPVTGISTVLSVLGADDGGEAALTYTWSVLAAPAGGVAFGANGTNAARTTLATVAAPGSYQLRATIRDADGLVATSDVTVVVVSTPVATPITIDPPSALLAVGGILRFRASAVRDQFGDPAAVAWTTSGGGTIASDGTYTAGATPGGPFTVQAAAGGEVGTAQVTISALPAPTVIVNAPAEGALLTEVPVLVSVSASAATALDEIRVNSVLLAEPNVPFFSGSLALDLPDGAQDIVVVAVDASGLQTSVTRHVTVAARPLPVTIISPADATDLAVRHVWVQVSAPSLTATVTINGQPAVLTGQIAYAQVTLAQGANTITALASEGGRSGSDQVGITFTPQAGTDPDGVSGSGPESDTFLTVDSPIPGEVIHLSY